MRTMVLPILFTISVIACSSGTGTSPDTLGSSGPNGLEIYSANCKKCHGRNGGLGMGKAKDLSVSVLSTEEMIAIISNGKGNMVPYKEVLTPKQIEAVAAYVHTLRKAE